MYLFVPPHVPSGLFTEAEALGVALFVDEVITFVDEVLALDEVVALVDDDGGFVDVETLDEVEGGLVDVEGLSELEDPLDEHVPEPGLQPVPQ